MRRFLIALALLAGTAHAYDYNNPVPTAGSVEVRQQAANAAKQAAADKAAARKQAAQGVDDLFGDLSSGKNTQGKRQPTYQERQAQRDREQQERTRQEHERLRALSDDVMGN